MGLWLGVMLGPLLGQGLDWEWFLGWGILKFKCFWDMFDTYILRKGCGAKWSVDCSRPDNLARKQ